MSTHRHVQIGEPAQDVGGHIVAPPVVRGTVRRGFHELANENDDGLSAALLQESRADTTRNQAWHTALARYALAANADNRGVIDGWIET